MKYFTLDKHGILTPKNKTWYHIDIDTLNHYEPTGRHHWFPHLCEKNWFTLEMFIELIEFSISKFPTVDFTGAIIQGLQSFKTKQQ